jgi:hypothetical protein
MKSRDLGADASHLYQPNDFIALEMAKLAAERLSPSCIEAFQRDLHRMHDRSGRNRYVQLWDRVIAAGPDALRQLFVESSEHGQVMRSVVSFRAFVTKEERDQIFARHVRASGVGRGR